MLVSVTITDNREDEIVGAILSVVDHVDRVLIVDTGVTDETLQRAKRIAGDKFESVAHKWVDFSIARNAGIEAAAALGAEWIVIVDSDERLHLGVVDLRAALRCVKVDVVLVESADGHYPKEKILRAGSGARYLGPTHEALRGGARETLQGVTFSELLKTTDQLARKFERDVGLLDAYVKEHPDDPRWWYYLGQSLEGLGDRERAAAAYGECISRRKFGDEAAWSGYKQAEQLLWLERHEEAIVAAARGLGASATFPECAWVAAISAAQLHRTDQAIAWARIAEALGRYRGCGGNPRTFFRHMPAHYEMPYDVLRSVLPSESERRQAETDFHAAKRARLGVGDDDDLDMMSVSRRVLPERRAEARTMLRPERLSVRCPSYRATRIRFEPPKGWFAMNPSICRHRGRVWCVVRTVNYTMRGRQYTVHDRRGIVRTENYLGTLRATGELLKPRRMRDLDRSPRVRSGILGYEDVRLASVAGKGGVRELVGSATVCDRETDRRLIARLDLTAAGDVRCATVQPSNQSHEKNWMPMSIGGRHTWIYSLDPTAILPGPLRDCPLSLDHLRGGAATPLDDGYLCVAHEVVEAEEGRVYLHRFVRLDARFFVTAVSRAWVFDHHGIEFCAGMVLDGPRLILSYGIEDREAWFARVNLKEVLAMKWIDP